MAKVEHFEIPAGDMKRAQAFYKSVLEFEYEPWADDMGMLRSSEEGGIGGDLHQRGLLPHPTIVFTVDDLEDTVAAAIANGGEQIGEIQPLNGTARWVYIKDSEGNIVGLYDERG